ncbi:MAG TPA: hypothetical protein ENK34_07230 [Rhodobacteraceae bacterium]|nr:hypothetical protein [Paracoccaceae bacterium]
MRFVKRSGFVETLYGVLMVFLVFLLLAISQEGIYPMIFPESGVFFAFVMVAPFLQVVFQPLFLLVVAGFSVVFFLIFRRFEGPELRFAVAAGLLAWGLIGYFAADQLAGRMPA